MRSSTSSTRWDGITTRPSKGSRWRMSFCDSSKKERRRGEEMRGDVVRTGLISTSLIISGMFLA